jgi:hypothetical protein
MSIPKSLCCTFVLACSVAVAQPARNAFSPFPGGADFPELRKTVSETSIDEPALLSGIEGGRLFSDVGFEQYTQRTYSGEVGDISVAIATLMDFRAAYSVLTLRSGSAIREGPPGDAFADNPGSVSFFQGKRWVRITGRTAPPELLQRLAMVVSERLGPRGQKPPSLIRHLPATGYGASSLKYFPGLKSFESYSGSPAFKALHLDFDAEIAQARYAVDNQTGTLTLLDFPTPEVAEEYFAQFSAKSSDEKGQGMTYVKRAGPLVAVLTGRLGPAAADKILGSINHSYAIRWIFEKPKRKGITWGVPVRILHTVAGSILFVIMLCAVAVAAGAGLAFFRYIKRRRTARDAPDELLRTDSTHLRLR